MSVISPFVFEVQPRFILSINTSHVELVASVAHQGIRLYSHPLFFAAGVDERSLALY